MIEHTRHGDQPVQFEIFFDDLNHDTQKQLLQTYGISGPEEMNWDTMGLAVIEIERDATK